MLDPVTDEVADLARIKLDDNLKANLAIGNDQERSDVLAEIEQLGSLVKIKAGRLEGLHREVNPRITDQLDAAAAGQSCPDRNGPNGTSQWPWRLARRRFRGSDRGLFPGGTGQLRGVRDRSTSLLSFDLAMPRTKAPERRPNDADLETGGNQLRPRQSEPALRGRGASLGRDRAS